MTIWCWRSTFKKDKTLLTSSSFTKIAHTALTALFIASASQVCLAQGDVEAIPHGTPNSVRALIERRIACNHWAGEDAHDDKDRLAEILAAARELRCQSLDQDQHALEMKFSDKPKIVHLLKASRDWPG